MGKTVDYRIRFWAKVDKSGGDNACWPWIAGKTSDGRGSFWKDGRNVGAHVVCYEIANGPVLDGFLIRHSCDNGACCNEKHLLIGTVADNVADRVSRGRSAIGEVNGNSKLADKDVIEIRSVHKQHDKKMGTTALSKRFMVTRKVIVDIIHRRIWRHL